MSKANRQGGYAEVLIISLFIIIAMVVGIFVYQGAKTDRFYKECTAAQGIVHQNGIFRIDCYDKDNHIIKVPSGSY